MASNLMTKVEIRCWLVIDGTASPKRRCTGIGSDWEVAAKNAYKKEFPVSAHPYVEYEIISINQGYKTEPTSKGSFPSLW